ncbi:diaminopimelate decarboxylase [Desulfobotulus alkaliphilus]|uniref:Diaminopimelate decarboxylase n=1 Tax=Desulfobotulus alkaliphilus TaxID=622671 RepID=A0A562RTJ2_9BACT|nr:diaminopimelate decarboxylase [Desulfobotulus alkaliphilus]TWI72437.1 diaminopimelate decarboxylase [Desulfobotulus alkaliphilus]
MPMSGEFKDRLFPRLPEIAAHFGTPFHIYDEKGILETGAALKRHFSGIPGFREYFAVKALPNPTILKLMQSMGFGFDCSSRAELTLARKIGAGQQDILFTSNNTSQADFDMALENGGCILNLDDISLIPKVPVMPETICFRYNPGPRRTGNAIIGNPVEAKYGITHEQVIPAYRAAMERGATRFGMHTMVVSNERNYTYMVETARMLLTLAADTEDALGIRFDFLNIGGGLGIPYRPEDTPLNLEAMGKEVTALFKDFEEQRGYMPALFMESGRFMTGPHGVLVTRAINHKDTYRRYVGVDACMSSLMRPGMYEAYHHIDVLGKDSSPADPPVDVVGALCENNDKFAVQRPLPPVEEGDLLIIHDTGAHGHAMGFNYNGQLRPQELLFHEDGGSSRIRRGETIEDLFATLTFQENRLKP